MNDRHASGITHESDAAAGENVVPAASRRMRLGLVLALALVLAGAVGLWLSGGGDAGGRAAPERKGDAAVAVRTAAAQRETLELDARYTGELDADAAEIAAREGGLLESVRVRIGDRVKKGDVLARVETAQLVRQVAEVQAQRRSALASAERVQAELALARSQLERTEPLLADQLASAQEVDALRSRVAALTAERAIAEAEAEQAQARHALLAQQISDARMIAPFDGAVAERYLDPGTVVQPGQSVLRLVRDGPLRVRFRVPERELGRVREGLPFELTTRATGQERFAGRVERISAAISREDRSAAVEGVLQDEVPALRPGMYAEISLRLGTLEGAITVPGQAVLERAGEAGVLGSGVFVVDGGAARWTKVRVVGRSGERVAVEGLQAGAQVITMGHERIRDGTSVLSAGDQA
jgi:membrane fusion protein, multidrug efflux system